MVKARGKDRTRWRCFHCDETFTRAQERHAKAHFGANEGCQPVCLIRSAGEDALLDALRKAEDELVGHRAEDSRILRAMHAMAADYRVQLRRAEEEGYNKGVRDMSRPGWHTYVP